MKLETNNSPKSVALIGSFRRHYDYILQARNIFAQIGLQVTSPIGTNVIKPEIAFVRFDTDPHGWEDHFVQTVALHRILRSDFVYVVSPEGYTGKTTCYEVGRIIEHRRPLYFSEQPNDLPLWVPASHVLNINTLQKQLETGEFYPITFHSGTTCYELLESDLLNREYKTDDEIPQETSC